MNAILIHFVGFFFVDGMIPGWAGEVESGFAFVWYASFAAVDVIALSFARAPYLKKILAVSCAWSAALSVEAILLQDMLQSMDGGAQVAIDASLAIIFAINLISYMARKAHKVNA